MPSHNGTVAKLVLDILEDRNLVELKQRNRDLLAQIDAQNEYISNVLRSRRAGEERPRVDARLEICEFCRHIIPRSNMGEECPCHEARYCSSKCRRMDWRRHHRHNCKHAEKEGLVDSVVAPMEQID